MGSEEHMEWLTRLTPPPTEWETSVWQTLFDGADRVDLLCLPNQDIVSEEGWPDTFWQHISERHMLLGEGAQRLVSLFRELEPSTPARCHMPPWGLAFYEGDALLFTTTLCFRCNNAYIYTSQGKELRAFDPNCSSAVDLRNVLKQHLPLQE